MKRKKVFITVLILFLSITQFGNDCFGQIRHQRHRDSAKAQNVFNPMISVIGDLVFEYSDWDEYEIEDGFQLRSIDLNFSSNIDVYARADFFFAVERGEEAEGIEYKFALEEGYITFLTLPLNLQLRLGKMRTKIGKANTMHLHALPWHEYPSALSKYFSDDGLCGLGGDLSVMLPLPFFTELSYQLQKDESDIFISDMKNEWYHNFHLKSFFEISYDHSLELGASCLLAKSDVAGWPDGDSAEPYTILDSTVYGFNFKYLWKPATKGLYKTLILWGEAFLIESDKFPDKVFSFFVGADHKVSRRLSIGIKYDYSEELYDPKINEQGYTGYLTYAQSEYAFFRGGYTYVDRDGESENRFFLQLNFGIGPHRAHKF